MKPVVFVIMGVAGSGKTTVGQGLAKSLSITFLDADSFHPKVNIDKMKLGIPLNDSDRLPWLSILASQINKFKNEGLVMACSALKNSYRIILAGSNEVQWVYLKIDKQSAKTRLLHRQGHFMPKTLIDSQFETLEEPTDALNIDARLTSEEIVRYINTKFST